MVGHPVPTSGAQAVRVARHRIGRRVGHKQSRKAPAVFAW